MPPGYRINILPAGAPATPHKSGARDGDGLSPLPCPNCDRPLFPALDLDFRDPRLAVLSLWNLPRLTVYFCPACFLYTEPFFIEYTPTGPRVHGGYRDGGQVIHHICLPYEWRPIELTTLPATVDLPAILSRQAGEGVYHQIGGAPSLSPSTLTACPLCTQEMKFAGILDNDDLNIPLYEDDHRPISLIIGDEDCMHLYTCTECHVLGLKWSRQA